MQKRLIKSYLTIQARQFARAVKTKDLKSKMDMPEVKTLVPETAFTPKLTSPPNSNEFEQLKLLEEIKTVDSLNSIKDCFLLAEMSP